jgi:hypothetical protein
MQTNCDFAEFNSTHCWKMSPECRMFIWPILFINVSCYTILFCYRPNNLIYNTCPVAMKVAATFILFFSHLCIKFYIGCELLNWINQCEIFISMLWYSFHLANSFHKCYKVNMHKIFTKLHFWDVGLRCCLKRRLWQPKYESIKLD